jgi:hypothetical protein
VLATDISHRPEVRELLDSIQRHGEELDRLAAHLAELEGDAVSRYYVQSVEVFGLRHAVRTCRDLLASLAPDGAQLNPWFVAICREACAQSLRAQIGGGRNWQAQVRPLLEGLWHCEYFVRLLARFGRELEEVPARLPAGWTTLCELYGLR